MYTRQQIRELYKKLPQETREVLASTEFSKTVEDTVASYHLSPQQVDDLLRLVSNTLIGVEKESDLTQNIQKNLSTDPNTAAQIRLDIKNKVLDKLSTIHDLSETNIAKEDGDETETPSIPQAAEKSWPTPNADKNTAETIRGTVAKQKSVKDLLNEITQIK
jgi:hypothetical protein